MSTINLVANPESYYFCADEYATLVDVLKDIDSHTVILPISKMTDLCLDEEGKAGHGYRYSQAALIQLCSLVAPGLSQLVLDVAGQWRKAGQEVKLFSSVLAIDMLNRCIKLRFNQRLFGLQLVRNTKLKTIDGVIGAKYRYLANGDFFSRVSQENAQYKHKFLEACLYGRQFIIRYKNALGVEQYNIADEPYDLGYHFANSEIGGQAVRAALLLIRCNTGECALCPFTAATGGRVVHSGRDFEKRLHALMGRITQKWPTHATITRDGQALDAISLQLGDEQHEKRVRLIVQMLTRRKLTQGFARRVVSSAAVKGRINEDATIDALPSERRLVMGSRTGYDLFVALIRESRRLPIDQREIAEQVAYALLTGKIRIY